MKHFKYFDNETAYNSERNGNYEEPWVSWTEGRGVNYNKNRVKEPLTFNILSDGEIGWKIGSGSTGRTIQYSKNGGVWTDITSTTEGTTISVVTGDSLRFKGDTWPGSGSSDYSNFSSTCDFATYGNPASLKYGEELTGNEALAQYCYYCLFHSCINLISAYELSIPATTLAKDCYAFMFFGCTSLTSAPELPATTLAEICYQSMFYSCTSLTSAPELPATTLAKDCYAQMFAKSGIISAPALPATALTDYCYYMMFRECLSLTTAPVLPATALTDHCYYYMFYGCTNLASTPALPATTLEQNCCECMFRGCTSLTTAPELPAATLTNRCYYMMFYGCSNLNYVKCLATDISASGALSGWLAKVSSTGTFYKATGVTYPSGTSGIPTGWTVVEV